MKCKYYKEVFIQRGANTSKVFIELFKLCNNPILMDVRKEGILLQYCVYNKDNEIECPF